MERNFWNNPRDNEMIEKVLGKLKETFGESSVAFGGEPTYRPKMRVPVNIGRERDPYVKIWLEVRKIKFSEINQLRSRTRERFEEMCVWSYFSKEIFWRKESSNDRDMRRALDFIEETRDWLYENGVWFKGLKKKDGTDIEVYALNPSIYRISED